MTPSAPLPPLDRDAVVGCLLGQAIGDMMGLPAENLSARRIARWFPKFDRPRFLFGYGLGSDDTEHACMTANALLRSGGDCYRFSRSLGWRLRWWFLGVPAGIGKATLKACMKLWLGWPSDRSGVKSAGNGPVMRAAVVGLVAPPAEMTDWVREATRLTHTDPQAAAGARMIAHFVQMLAFRPYLGDWVGWLLAGPDAEIAASLGPDMPPTYDRESDLGRNLKLAAECLFRQGMSVAEFVEQLGLTRKGVTGYIAHTVPVAIYAFLRHPDDYRAAIESVIRCGGDTDTVAAITGALVGTRVGKAGIPKEWLDAWCDWPRSIRYMERLGERLAEGSWRTAPQPTVGLAWWAIPFRNLFFFGVVVCHVIRRLFPPY